MARPRPDQGLESATQHADSASSVTRPPVILLTSHPLPSTDVELLEDTCECSISVTKAVKGYTCHVSVTATVPAEIKTAWHILVHPDNAEIFRQIDRSTFRRVLAQGPATAAATGRRLVRVDNVYTWHFGVFGGTFITRMLQDQDHSALVLRFEALPGSGGVARLRGEWRLRAGKPGWTVVTLEQDLALGVWAPPLVRRAVHRIASEQVRRVIEDLQNEAIKIKEEQPTLSPYDTKVQDKEIGERPQGGGTKAADRAQVRRLAGDGGTMDLKTTFGGLQKQASAIVQYALA